MKLISIVTPCYNEQENVYELYSAVRSVFSSMPEYRYEHVFIDNCSTDNTVNILKDIALGDGNIKIIVNIRNFGHIRSPYYGLLQAKGDAAILLVADFQDPPELIRSFVGRWESGAKIVIGRKERSKENKLMFMIRRIYYRLMARFSDSEHIEDFTGFGLYDRSFLEVLRSIDDPYPYFRGLVAELGFERSEIVYTQPKRKHGRTKNNFLTLFDMALTGMVNNTKAPLRMATLAGFSLAFVSFLIAVFYLVYKLIYWEKFELGSAPVLIGLFFFASTQLFFIGIIGEYVGAVLTQVRRRPLVIEKERINFPESKK